MQQNTQICTKINGVLIDGVIEIKPEGLETILKELERRNTKKNQNNRTQFTMHEKRQLSLGWTVMT